MLANILSLVFITNDYKLSAENKNRSVILGGDSIGLQVSTKVTITGKYEINTETSKESPWKNSNIEINDIIDAIENCEVDSINDIETIISKYPKDTNLTIDLIRKNKIITTKIKLVADENGRKTLGLYVKDTILGVGTITYIDKTSNSFGALGHGIIDTDSSLKLNGKITDSLVKGVRKALPGTPGEKKAILEDNIIGNITMNTNIGVFGIVNDETDILKNSEIYVSDSDEVQLGKAQIITVISEEEKEYFDIEIVEVKKQDKADIKGIKFIVTDKELLSKTGGIIQGMSGSPIIQNGKLVGAVSHVVVDDPKYGYGVFIEWMLQNTY